MTAKRVSARRNGNQGSAKPSNLRRKRTGSHATARNWRHHSGVKRTSRGVTIQWTPDLRVHIVKPDCGDTRERWIVFIRRGQDERMVRWNPIAQTWFEWPGDVPASVRETLERGLIALRGLREGAAAE